jgi:hypothetical protein
VVVHGAHGRESKLHRTTDLGGEKIWKVSCKTNRKYEWENKT